MDRGEAANMNADRREMTDTCLIVSGGPTDRKFAAEFVKNRKYPYVSMLSEKHRGSSNSFLKGMYAGTLAWFSALGRKERSSSMIYVFRKKR